VKKLFKYWSNLKDFLVKDNVGLHFGVAYVIFNALWKIDIWVALILSFLGIFLTEVIDKYIFKGKFSWKDIIAGILGVLFCYLINK